MDLEAVGPWGPKATFERKPLLMYICMNLPDCLKILGGNSAFAYFFHFLKAFPQPEELEFFFHVGLSWAVMPPDSREMAGFAAAAEFKGRDY